VLTENKTEFGGIDFGQFEFSTAKLESVREETLNLVGLSDLEPIRIHESGKPFDLPETMTAEIARQQIQSNSSLAMAELAAVATVEQAEAFRVKWLGVNGEYRKMLKLFGNTVNEERARISGLLLGFSDHIEHEWHKVKERVLRHEAATPFITPRTMTADEVKAFTKAMESCRGKLVVLPDADNRHGPDRNKVMSAFVAWSRSINHDVLSRFMTDKIGELGEMLYDATSSTTPTESK